MDKQWREKYDKVNEIRKKQGISIEKAATQAGYTLNQYANWRDKLSKTKNDVDKVETIIYKPDIETTQKEYKKRSPSKKHITLIRGDIDTISDLLKQMENTRE